jgi:3-hydroxy-9,10-secoandrosta-1,3,5(10)-triene-9,17-dione monooxygenase reductase component
MHTHSPDIVNRIGKPLGRIPSGVYILTASHAGASSAMLASWVQQAAFDPPAISVAVAKGRPIVELIRAGKRFAISVIPQDDKTLMKRYARGVKDGEDPFAGVATQKTASGIPVLSDALAWLEAEVIHSSDFGGDHELLIAKVTDGAILREGAAFAHQRGNGFHY